MEAGDEQDIYTRNYGSRNSEISGSADSHLHSLGFSRFKKHESKFPASPNLRIEDQYPILKIFWEEENSFLGSSFVLFKTWTNWVKPHTLQRL